MQRLVCFVLGLWNHVFLFSNLALFVLLPFSYLFTESSGFSGHKKGVMARVYETFTVFSLLAFIVFGMTYVISALREPERNTFQALFSEYNAISGPTANFHANVHVHDRVLLSFPFQIWENIICHFYTHVYHF